MATAADFAQAVDALNKASREARQNTGKEIGKIVGKDLLKITDPFVSSFKQIPGVQTLGNVGKTLFNKGFAALKEKRANDLLRRQLGLSKEQFKSLKDEKKLSDQRKAVNDQLLSASQNLLGFSEEKLEATLVATAKDMFDKQGRLRDVKTGRFVSTMEGLFKSQMKVLKKGNELLENPKPTAAAKEEADAEEAAQKRRMLIFNKIADGIKTLNDTFMAKIKEKGKAGLGLVAALIAAPIVALLSFFKEIGAQLTQLGIIGDKGLLGKMFAPIGRFFTRLKDFFKSFTLVKVIGGFIDDVIKGAGRVLRPVSNFFSKLSGFFRTFVNYVKGLVAASASATGILRFAAGFGKVLGKLFLPVTIVMSAFDFITGFIDGFKESEGNNIVSRFIDGVGGGLSKLVGNLIGIPLDLLKSGVSFIAGMLGFEKAEEFLDSFSFTDFITDIVKLPYTLLSKAVDYIVGVFTGENDLIGDIVSGLGNLMDTAKQFIKDMLKKILPNPKGNLLSKLASKAIPDSVYEFAGIDPDTGQIIPDPVEPSATAEPDIEGDRKDLEKELAGDDVTEETAPRRGGRRRGRGRSPKATAAPEERRQQQADAAKERTRMRDAQDEMNAGGKGQVAVNAPNVDASSTSSSSSTTVTSTAMKPKEPTTQAAIQSAYM